MGIQVSKIGEFKGHQQSIYSMVLMDAGHFLSAGGDGMLVKWEVDSPDGTLISRIPDQVFSLAYNPLNTYCALGTRSGSIYEIDTESMVVRRQWIAHSSSIFELLYKDNDLISCGGDGTLKKWQADETSAQMTLKLSEKSLRCLTMEGETIWVAGSEGKVWQIDSHSFRILDEFQAGTKSIFGLAKQKERLLTAGRDAHFHTWKDGKEQSDIAAHWYTIHALSINKEGTFLATGSMDKSIKLWDAESLELLKVIDRQRYGAHLSSVNRILWLDNTRFISCSDDRMIYGFEIS